MSGVGNVMHIYTSAVIFNLVKVLLYKLVWSPYHTSCFTVILSPSLASVKFVMDFL